MGRRLPQRCSDSEKYEMDATSLFREAVERMLEKLVLIELDNGDGLQPMVVGLELPEREPPDTCRALAFSLGEPQLLLHPKALGESLLTASRMAPGSAAFGEATLPSKRSLESSAFAYAFPLVTGDEPQEDACDTDELLLLDQGICGGGIMPRIELRSVMDVNHVRIWEG